MPNADCILPETFPRDPTTGKILTDNFPSHSTDKNSPLLYKDTATRYVTMSPSCACKNPNYPHLKCLYPRNVHYKDTCGLGYHVSGGFTAKEAPICDPKGIRVKKYGGIHYMQHKCDVYS